MDSKKVASTILALSFRLCILAMAVIFTILFAGKAYSFGISIFNEIPMSQVTGMAVSEVNVTIPEGASDMDVAQIMEESGLTESKMLFFVQLFLSDHKTGENDAFVPGTYLLNTGMTATEIMVTISPEIEEETEQESTAVKETTAEASKPSATEETTTIPSEGAQAD